MHSRRGFVLPMVIFGLAVMSALLLAVLITGADDRMGSRYALEGARSFYAADAGLNQLLAEWNLNDYSSLVGTPGTTHDFGWQSLPGGSGRYHGEMRKLSDKLIELSVEGRSGSAREGLRTLQVLLVGSPIFSYAAYGASGASFSGGGTDSWDSRLGPYASSNCATLGVTCDGDVGSGGGVSLAGGTIKDSVFAAGSITGCALHVIGGCATRTTVSTPSVACPGGPPQYTTAADLTLGGATYTPSTGDLSLSVGDHTFTLGSVSQYRFHDVTLWSDFNIPGTSGHVDIYIDRQLAIQPGGFIANLTQDPGKLTIWGCGTNNDSWTIMPGSASYYGVYAPNHAVLLSGAGAIYGAVVGASVDVSGPGTIHYDRALAAGPAIVFIPRFWTEITR